jgi:potassium channel
MESNFSSYNPHDLDSSMKRKHHDVKEDYYTSSSSFNLRNVSKLILPPLGVSKQNSVCSKGWIISPMDSRYR